VIVFINYESGLSVVSDVNAYFTSVCRIGCLPKYTIQQIVTNWNPQLTHTNPTSYIIAIKSSNWNTWVHTSEHKMLDYHYKLLGSTNYF